MDRLTQRLKREIRLKASVSLLVSLSTWGADKFDAPKLLSSKAKKRFNTWQQKEFFQWWTTWNLWNRIKWRSKSFKERILRGNNGSPCTKRQATWKWNEWKYWRYHKIADNYSCKEEWDARRITDQHAVPHWLNPLAAKDAENDHKRMHKVDKVPPWQFLVGKPVHVVYWIKNLINKKVEKK